MKLIDGDALRHSMYHEVFEKDGEDQRWDGGCWIRYRLFEKVLEEQPERKAGKWKRISPAGIYECSLCGQNVMTDDIEAYSFCHGCGAEMEVSE